jgi:hypothetical protein
MSRLYRNWTIHNLIGHPLSEIIYWFFGEEASGRFHDLTVPPHKRGTGRG